MMDGESAYESGHSWQERPAWGAVLLVAYLFLAALPLILAFALKPSSHDPFLEELGKGAALVGFALLALQVALGARLRLLDAPFGLDVVMQFHKGMAILAGLLILSHPVLLSLGEGHWHMFRFDTPWRLNLGKIGSLLLVSGILCALLFKKLGLKYQIWRFFHKGAILVVIVGFIHALAIGPDLRPLGMKVYWWLLLAMSVGLFVFRNVFVPLRGRRRFRVTGVQQETHDTFTLELDPVAGGPIPHRPGQFMWLKLKRPGRPSEEHPFTISSSPTREPPMTVTIKQSGDFTDTIGQTQPGDTAEVEAPYGRFSFLHHAPSKFLFIAGGVGITPMLSMLRCLKDTKDERPAVLIYGNKTEEDIICREELENLPDNVKVVHVLSAPHEGWNGLKGHITQEMMGEQAREVLAEADAYLCGPPPMMHMVISSLRSLGIPHKRIHYERFAL